MLYETDVSIYALTTFADCNLASKKIEFNLIHSRRLRATTPAVLKLSSTRISSAINPSNTAGSISLSLSSDSTWSLTGNSYLTTFSDDDTTLSNIQSNGYNIYYKSSANSWLNGATVALNGGGKLIPY